STNTLQPCRANSIAPTNPFGPEPMTIASHMSCVALLIYVAPQVVPFCQRRGHSPSLRITKCESRFHCHEVKVFWLAVPMFLERVPTYRKKSAHSESQA